MDRRDISKVLLGSAAGAAMLSERATAQTCVAPCYAQTAAESASGVTPTNTSYEPGVLHRYKSGSLATDGSTDWAPALQAACNQSIANGAAVVIPGCNGFYRCNTAITLPFGCRIHSDGTQPTLRFYGDSGFVLAAGGAFLSISGIEIFGCDVAGNPDPKTFNGIICQGTNSVPTRCNYVFIKDVYMRGWAKCINFEYTWNSTLENVTTLNCAVGVRLFGQSVTNTINYCRLLADTACVQMARDSGVRGEGLRICNTLFADATYGISTDGFLALEIANCDMDQIADTAIDCTNSMAMSVSGTWIFAANKGIFIRPIGSPAQQDVTVSGCRIQTSAANSKPIDIGFHNRGISILGGTLNCGSSGTTRCMEISEPCADISITGTCLINPTANASILDARGILQFANLTGKVTISITVPVAQTVASAAAIAIPLSDVVKVTGTTNITSITNAPVFKPWRRVTLIFTGALTVTDGANLRLAGNFVTTSNDTLTLVCDEAGIWFEAGRSVN